MTRKVCQLPVSTAEELMPGNLVAKHRKVHLFDIDIPGRQTFKVS